MAGISPVYVCATRSVQGLTRFPDCSATERSRGLGPGVCITRERSRAITGCSCIAEQVFVKGSRTPMHQRLAFESLSICLSRYRNRLVSHWTRGLRHGGAGLRRATRGSNDAVRGLCGATRGSHHAIRELHHARAGSNDAIPGSCNATRGSNEWTREANVARAGSNVPTPGACAVTRGSCDVTRGSNEAEPLPSSFCKLSVRLHASPRGPVSRLRYSPTAGASWLWRHPIVRFLSMWIAAFVCLSLAARLAAQEGLQDVPGRTRDERMREIFAGFDGDRPGVAVGVFRNGRSFTPPATAWRTSTARSRSIRIRPSTSPRSASR